MEKLGAGIWILGGGAYYILCLVGFASVLGAKWLVAALLIPPLDVAYPLVSLATGHGWPPLGWFGVGVIVIGFLAALNPTRARM